MDRPSIRAALARIVGALMCWLLAASPSAADWLRLDSPNFIVIGDVSAGRLREIAVQFEGFRETLSRVLSEASTATPVPTVVIVFPSDRAFTPFKPRFDGKPIDVNGLFLSGRDISYIALVSGGDRDLRVIFHEYAHLIISNASRNVPVWLSEGLAEYYSTYELRGGGRQAVLGLAVTPHLQLLNSTSFLPLDELRQVTVDSPLYNEGARRSIFYAQSWALTHLLLVGQPNRTAQLSMYLRNVSLGVPQMEAWQKAFGADRLDQELRNYVQRQVFNAYQYTFPEKIANFAATPARLPEADAEGFLADFLALQNRRDEAAARLTSALKLDARNARANVMTARLEIANSETSAAATRLLTLATVDDWLVAYYTGIAFADLADNQPDGPNPEHLGAARRHLEAVARSHADLPSVLVRLAALEVAGTGVPSSDARTAIERARRLAPGRADYAFVHAQLLARQGDLAAARDVLGPLMSSAYSENVRDSARRLMTVIVELQTRQSAGVTGRSADAPDGLAAAASDVRPTDALSTPVTTPSERPPANPSPRRVVPVYRPVQPGEARVEGRLERIECTAAGAATFHVATVDGPVQFPTLRMAEVEFITYRDDLSGNVACGALKDPMRVYLTWTRTSSTAPQTVIAIEFLPRD